MVRQKKYALIWWVNTAQKDVIPLTTFPTKQREVGCVAKLPWKDAKTGKSEHCLAKIVLIGTDSTELHRVILTDQGTVHNPADKIFAADVIQQRKTLKESEKILDSIRNSNKTKTALKIQQEQPIFRQPNMYSAHATINKENSMPNSSSNYTLEIPQRSSSTPFSHCTNVNDHNQLQISEPSSSSFNTANIITEGMSEYYHWENYNRRYTEEVQAPTPSPATPSPATPSPTTPSPATPSPATPSPTTPSPATSMYGMNLPTQGGNETTLPLNQSEVRFGKKSSFDMNYETDDKESDTSDSDEDSEKNQARVLAGMIPTIVTKRDIQFHEALLQAMKYCYESQRKMNIESTATFSIPDEFLTPGSGREEVSPGCRFYISSTTRSLILSHAERENDWKVLVRDTIIEVYGDSIANYSATGKRGGRPPIDNKLFKGLFKWANSFTNGNCDRKEFIKLINKTASNKRKYRKSKDHGSQGKKPKLNAESNLESESNEKNNRGHIIDLSAQTQANRTVGDEYTLTKL